MRVPLPDLAATERLGERIAAGLRPGDVVALAGGLGAGKTTLARAILRALGHTGEVPSPSFMIVEPYEDLSVPVMHADFYRLTDPSEARELGLDEWLDAGALLAEWPEQAGGFAGPEVLSIRLENDPAEERIAIVEAGADWQKRGPWN